MSAPIIDPVAPPREARVRRADVLNLVEQAAYNTDLLPKKTEYLLDDLNDLLGSSKE